MSRRIASGISWNVPLFPPAPVAILVDGRPLASYVHAYVAGGRVLAPVVPLLTRLADRVWYEGDTLVIERGARRVRVPLEKTFPDQFDGAYIAIGPVSSAGGVGLLGAQTPPSDRAASGAWQRCSADALRPSGAVGSAGDGLHTLAAGDSAPIGPARRCLDGPRSRFLRLARNEHHFAQHAPGDAFVGFACCRERKARRDPWEARALATRRAGRTSRTTAQSALARAGPYRAQRVAAGVDRDEEVELDFPAAGRREDDHASSLSE